MYSVLYNVYVNICVYEFGICIIDLYGRSTTLRCTWIIHSDYNITNATVGIITGEGSNDPHKFLPV